MRKQLTLKKLTLFVLSTLLCLLLAIAGITLGSSTQAFADEPVSPDTPAENPSGHDATHTLQAQHVIYPATCVEPGIAVAYCETCGCNVSVVLPADGKSHSVPFRLADTEGENTKGFCELCGAVTGGYNKEVVKGTDAEHPTHVEVTAIKNSELTSITIPATVDVEGVGKDLPVHVKEGAFEGNDTIKEVMINGAVEIGQDAFKDCSKLETLSIQNGTEIIGANAFEGCEKIAKVELPDSVVSIGADAFEGTAFAEKNLTNDTQNTGYQTLKIGDAFLLKVVDTTPAAPSHGRRNAPTDPIASYTVADKIKVIADGALKALKSLTEVNLPAGLKTVGKDAFNNSVTTIYIGSKDVTVTDATAYTKVDGLNYAATSPVDIYYWGDYDKSLDRLAAIAKLRFLSETEPNDEHHNYWYHNEKGVPTAWAHLTELKVTNNMTEFLVGDPFVDDDLVVTAYYDEGEPKVLTRGSYTQKPVGKGYETGKYYLDTSKYVYTTAGGYVITVNYLYRECSYTVTVVPSSNVTINYNGNGQATESHSIPSTKPYTLPEEPNHYVGYTFAGWLVQHGEDSVGTLMQAGQEVTVNGTEHITITAQWTVHTPDVKMNYDKGVQGTAQFTAEFDKATETYTVKVSGTPTRTGYTFTGWKWAYTEGETSGELGAEGGSFDVALDDTMTVTVTAKWEAKKPAITMDYDNGTGVEGDGYSVGTLQTKEDGTEYYTVTITANPTRTGYTFDKWTVTCNEQPVNVNNAEGVYTFEVTLADEMTVTVTAKWEQLYTVSVGDKGEATVTINEEKTYYEKNTVVTFTVKVNPGFKLTNVTADNADVSEQGGTYSVTVGTQNIIITVTTEQVKVNTSVKDATGATLNVAQDGAKATITVEGTPYKMGHDFQNWTVTVDGAPKDYAEKLEIELGNEDVNVVYTANWKVKTPNVSLVVGDGAQQNEAKYEVGALTEGKYTITVSGTPTREGYRFDGWTVSGATPTALPANGGEVTVALSDNMTVTVTAKWTQVFKLSVTAQNATVTYGGTYSELQTEYVVGDEVTVTITPNKDYIILDSDINVKGATSYTTKDGVVTITFAAADDPTVTVTATVTRVYKITVERTIEAGGSAELTAGTREDGNYRANDKVTLTVKANDGYRIKSVKVGSEEKLTKLEDTYTVILTVTDSDITVNVVFVQMFTVTYDLGTNAAESAEKPAAVTVEANSELQLPAEPAAKQYYKFAGWKVGESNDLKAAEDKIEVTGNLTITAQWTEVTYTLTVNATNAQVDYTEGQKEDNKYHEGDVVKFKVSAEKGYKISSVTAPNGTLTGPVEGVYTLTFKASNVTLTVKAEINYGTLENPLSIADALALVEDLKLGKNAFTEQRVYAKGKITAFTDKTNYYGDVTLQDESQASKTIFVYTVNMRDKSQSIDLNDIVIINGYIKNHEGTTIEFASKTNNEEGYVYIEQLNRGISDITVTNEGGATIDPQIPSIKENGQDVTFKVTAPDGKKISSVTVNGETIQADGEGNYKFTVHGDMTVDIKVVDASAATETTVGVSIPDYASKHNWTSNNKYSEVIIDDNITATMVTGTYSGIYNSSGQWQLYQSGGGSLTISAKNGATIKSVKITFDQKNDGSLLWNDTTYERGTDGTSGEIEVNDSSVTFTAKTTTPNKSNGQVKITAISVTYTGGKVLSDEDKVQAAAEAYELPAENKTYSEVKIYDLPTETTGGATITWALTGTSDYCSIVGGTKLNVTSLPEEDETVELTATFNLNGKTATNTYSVTIKAKSAGGGGDTEVKTWQKLTDAADLVEGAQIVLVSGNVVNGGTLTNKHLNKSNGTFTAGLQTLPTDAKEITLEKYKGASGYEDYWLFKLGDSYLYLSGTSNNNLALSSSVQGSNDGYFWKIDLSATHKIANKKGSGSYLIKYNGGSKWFSNYASTSTTMLEPDIYILKATASDEAADDMEVVNAVYTMAGNVTPSNTGTSPILWISVVSVGAVLISLGAVVVILTLRKKSE